MNNPHSKRILGIVGSPRRNGNTESLVDEVLAGAKEAGGRTEKVILNELEIKPCQGCFRCKEDGRCVQQDDMAGLLEKMQQNPIWVLGTPIYWWGPTAQFKAFLDRWVGADRKLFASRSVILAIPFGGGSSSYARHTVGMFTDVFHYLGMDSIATVLAPGASSLGSVRGHANVLASARRAGREAIEASP
jgi:multimeric flavodoxin WrbA